MVADDNDWDWDDDLDDDDWVNPEPMGVQGATGPMGVDSCLPMTIGSCVINFVPCGLPFTIGISGTGFPMGLSSKDKHIKDTLEFLGITRDYFGRIIEEDLYNLLMDEKKFQVLLTKLRNKAFW